MVFHGHIEEYGGLSGPTERVRAVADHKQVASGVAPFPFASSKEVGGGRVTRQEVTRYQDITFIMAEINLRQHFSEVGFGIRLKQR
jgi:hypothetical protein